MRIGLAVICVAGVVLAFVAYKKSDAQGVLARAKRDEAFLVRKEDAEIAAARQKARATLPEFFATMRNAKPSMKTFSVKVAVRDDHGVEYFWIKSFAPKGDRFTGTIDNTPRVVRSVAQGQTIEFAESEITDWMFMDNGRMKGNFSACALLAREPKDQQDAVKTRFGLTCDA